MKKLYYNIDNKDYLVIAYLGSFTHIKIEVYERNLSKKFFNKKKIGTHILENVYAIDYSYIEEQIKQATIDVICKYEKEETLRNFFK